MAGGFAESFAIYHIDCQEEFAAVDLLVFLDQQIELLKTRDPMNQLPMTQKLHDRISAHLEEGRI